MPLKIFANSRRRTLIFLFTAGVAIGGVGLSGCSHVASKHPPTPLPKMSPTVSLERDWQVLLGRTSDSDAVGLKITPDAKRIYVSATEGWVVALTKTPLDTWDDQVVWENKLDQIITVGPEVVDGKVYIGTNKGLLFALDATTGQMLWQQTLSSEVMTVPVVANGRMFVRTVNGKLYALNQNTGEKIWVIERELPNLSLRGVPPVTIVGQSVVVGWETGVVEALSQQEGSTLWSRRLLTPHGRTDLERMVDLQSRILAHQGRLYVLGFHGKLAALDPAKGHLLWQKKVSGYRNMVADNKALYLVDDADTVQGRDLQSGALLWQQKKLKYRQIGDLHLFQNHLVMGDGEGQILWLDPVNGSLEGYVTHEKGTAIVKLQPITDTQQMVILDEEGFVSAYHFRPLLVKSMKKTLTKGAAQ